MAQRPSKLVLFFLMRIPSLTHKHSLILKSHLRRGKIKTHTAHLSDNSLVMAVMDLT